MKLKIVQLQILAVSIPDFRSEIVFHQNVSGFQNGFQQLFLTIDLFHQRTKNENIT